jgi:7,8-dihydropterin-6-yl-methyl-4-(beta-D-ribofuranosyl)aminobenzene 5'-phosphate synthase
MKLTVLVDNNTIIDRYLLGEPAVSFFIESRGRRVLFDTGYSDVFLENADRLGIDLSDLDAVVLSHGHPDHSRGLPYLARILRESQSGRRPATGRRKPLLVAHPAAFLPKIREGGEDIGAGFTPAEYSDVFEYLPSSGSVDLGGGLTFMGQIPRVHSHESASIGFRIGSTDSPEKTVMPDPLEDDSALLCTVAEGVVIVTGCSHSGIANIIERALALSGTLRILDIVGGFHLLGAGRAKVEAVAAFLESRGVRTVHPCHCTDLAAKIGLSHRLDLRELGSGSVLEYS